MMNSNFFVALMIFAMIFAIGCETTTTQEEVDYVEDYPNEEYYEPVEPVEPVEPQEQAYVPDPPVHKSPTPDQEYDEGVYAPDMRGRSQETMRNIKAEIFAKEVSDSTVKEERTGAEKTYMKVEFKFFADRDILERLSELFERASRDDNYVIEDKKQPNRKSYVYKVWSQKGRVNLERTIKNTFEYEDVSVNMKNENYIEITPY